MNTKLKNTLAWIQEYTYGIDLRDNPEFSFEDISDIKTKTLIMFPEYSGLMGVILAFKHNASMLFVPLSEYTNPANEFEILLPESKLVACTWNARLFKQADAGEIVALGTMEDKDFDFVSKHYLAVYQGGDFPCKYSDFTGTSLVLLDEAQKEMLSEYMENEFSQLPEDIFSSLSTNVSKLITESLEEEEDYEQSNIDSSEDCLMDFPGLDIQSFKFELRNAASTDLDLSEEEDDENEDDENEDDDENN